MAQIRSYRELNVYQTAMECAVEIHQLTKTFPAEEKYSLVDQIRRSSRSVCANLAEAWRKRRYPKSFISTLNIAEGEAEETRVWLEFCLPFIYLPKSKVAELDDLYDKVLGQLVRMATNSHHWTIKK